MMDTSEVHAHVFVGLAGWDYRKFQKGCEHISVRIIVCLCAEIGARCRAVRILMP